MKWAPIFLHGLSKRKSEGKNTVPTLHQVIILYFRLKKFLTGQNPRSNQKEKYIVPDQLKCMAANFFDKDLQKLTPRYDGCLNSRGEIV
jgi:hypothetical protein